MRLFVAVELSDEARRAVASEQERLRTLLGASASGLRWVQPEHLHLTMVFLGEIDERRVPPVVEAVERPAAAAPFTMSLGGIGVFPARGAPRAVWIAVGEGKDPLIRVQQEIAGRLAAAGVVLDDRPFNPHLTLARWKDGGKGADRRRLTEGSGGTVARTEVTSVTLFQSRLSSTGPTYTPLARTPLNP